MQPKQVRRFTIADMMILVGASAVGMLILRPYLPGHLIIRRYFFALVPDRWGLWRMHRWLAEPGSCVVVPWMAALIVARLMPPRPSRLRLSGQPGFVACVAAMASLVPGLAWYATIRHRPGFLGEFGFEQAWTTVVRWIPPAMAGSWIALALARRWRPEPSWIDRMGRALGFYWIFVAASALAIVPIGRLLDLLVGWRDR